MALAQQVMPSNNSADIPSYDSSPRFWVNGSDFDHFSIIPLGWYARISQSNFANIEIDGKLMLIDASNANNPKADGIIYLSCDPEDYSGVLGPNDVLRMAANAEPGNSIILYSTRANHCEASNLRSLSAANGVFSTLDPALAATVATQLRANPDGMPAVISPDAASYSQPGSSSGYSGNDRGSGPTTAVAMIILYTITGLITALFIVIIVTGAIRAHRHPERYGQSNVAGRPRRSRAKGIARAMLDTIPIVKFGEKDNVAKKEAGDIEMAAAEGSKNEDNSKSADLSETEKSTSLNADGSDESGQLGCSICTEDFSKGEEVRVLPCNHKFHPECVDPWLLNVSGTCPLCRIDLRPKEEQQNPSTDGAASNPATAGGSEGAAAPPLGGRSESNASRRDSLAFAGLMSVASGTREDRIVALRRFRQQRRHRDAQGDSSDQQEEERRGLSKRLRERFRVRTRRQGEEPVDEERPPLAHSS